MVGKNGPSPNGSEGLKDVGTETSKLDESYEDIVQKDRCVVALRYTAPLRRSSLRPPSARLNNPLRQSNQRHELTVLYLFGLQFAWRAAARAPAEHAAPGMHPATWSPSVCRQCGSNQRPEVFGVLSMTQ
jgi:hypothetical protein